MQLKIYQRLNQLLLAIIALTILIVSLIVMNFSKLQAKLFLIIFLFIIYSLLCFFGFRFLEINWDKYLIQKMAINNQIVLARIKKVEALMPIKDSSAKYYTLWQLTVDFWDHDMNKHETTLVEKMNVNTKEIPFGNIFITYNKDKPKQLFVVPNVMVSHLEKMAPIAAAYEKNKAISIKYLNAYYKDGMIIETYKSSLKNQNTKENKEEK